MTERAVNSPLNYCCRALAMLGEDPITDLIPESGATNAACAALYDSIVDSLLSKYEWHFAKRDLDLSAIILVDAPPRPWVVQYNLPANTLRVIETDIPAEDYTLASNHDPADDRGTWRLYAMRTGVRARVIVRPLDENFPQYFIDALQARLAADLAPSVTGSGQLGALFETRAVRALSEAKMIDRSQQPSPLNPSTMRDPRAVPRGQNGWFPFLSFRH